MNDKNTPVRKFRVSVRQLLIFWLILFGSCSQALAEFEVVVDGAQGTVLPAMDPGLFKQPANPPWRISIGDAYDPVVGMVRTEADALCVEILAKHRSSGRIVGLKTGDGIRYSPGALLEHNAVACKSNSGALMFRVNVDSGGNLAAMRLVADTELVSRIDGPVIDIIWALTEGRNGSRREVGAYRLSSRPDFSESKWIRDGDSFALLLVDETNIPITAQQPANQFATEESTTPSVTLQAPKPKVKPVRKEPSKASVDKLTAYSQIGSADYRGPTAAAVYESRLPEFELKAGESSKYIYLQVVDSLLEPASGQVCLRAVYLNAEGEIRYFVREGSRYSTGKTWFAPGQGPELSSCIVGKFLAFPAFVNADSGDDKVRFLLNAPARKRFSLKETELRLVNILKPRQSYASVGRGNSTGYWMAHKSNGFAAYFWDGLQRKSSQTKLSIVTLNAPLERLEYFFNQESIPGSEKSLVLQAGVESQFQVGLEPVILPQAIRFCEDEKCEKPISDWRPASNPFPLNHEEINKQLNGAAQAFMVFDWAYVPNAAGSPLLTNNDTSPASSSVSMAQTPSQGSTAQSPAVSSNNESVSSQSKAPVASAGADLSTIAFYPTVSFGSYVRPLTTCLGRLVTTDASNYRSALFSLRDGMQWFVPDDKLAALPASAQVQVVYEKGRDGQPCPIDGLRSKTLDLASLLQRGSAGTIEQAFSVEQPLFAGYLHLGRKKLNQSRARWQDFLVFFNKVYQAGRSGDSWQDGLVIGRGRSPDFVRLVEPSNNFAKRLADNNTLDSIAGELASNGIHNIYFEDFVEVLPEQAGDAAVKLFYYDGQAESCDEYQSIVESSVANVQQAIVIASLDDYSPSNYKVARSLGDDEVVSVCAETNNVIVYALNGPDVEGNRQWPLVFDIILDDLQKLL